MILSRLGNKQKMSKEIQNYFPNHRIYIEPFFGAGGMYFNKPKVKYNFLNDNDSDVFNLFNVISTKKEEFEELFKIMPIDQNLFEYWKDNKETDEVRKAVRFVMLSNCSFLGQMNVLRHNCDRDKQRVFKYLDYTNKMIFDSHFMNLDFRKVLKSLLLKTTDKENAFIYCDPPYLGTCDNYEHSFKEKDSLDLFDVLCDYGVRFAMSEFDHPFIIKQAEERGLNIIIIGERRNIKNRRTEILITNYENRQQSLFA